jgi:glycosyltransferase involved in cell wall biosynthesis
MFIKVLQQDGKGKMNAVYRGMEISSGDSILIWDADGTVPPDDVAKMIDLSVEEKVFVKGDRLRGEMSHGAMQSINFLGNWFFALVWSPVLREKPSDVLCGSKIFPRRVFEVLDEDLLKRDPYGDFALLYAATLCKCKVKSIKVKYLARSYGVTNISRWSGALHLLVFVLWMYRKKYFSWAKIR